MLIFCVFLLFQQLEASLNGLLGPSEAGVSMSCPDQREDLSFKNHRNHHFLLSAILSVTEKHVSIVFSWRFFLSVLLETGGFL